jgi:branched-chain amino acid transport system substrate-binding protein
VRKTHAADRSLEVRRCARPTSSPTRSDFKFNKNQFPVQDFYFAKVVKQDNNFVHQITGKAFNDHADQFAEKCKM